MIYLLVQDSTGYDDCDSPVFAHHDKEVVERIHDQMMKHHQGMQEIAKRWQNDVAQIHKLMPVPPQPKYSELPPRPLVWKYNGWNNPDRLDYDEVLRKHNEELQKEFDRLKKEYMEYYKISQAEADGVYSHLYDRTFSIEEIEDNPNVDVRTL